MRRAWAGVEKFVLAGGSYGGFVSLDYALVHQDRLLALILRDTWAWGTRGMMQALKVSLTSKRIRAKPERQYRMWTGILLDDQDFAQGVGEMQALFAPDGPDIDPNAEHENTPRKGIIHAATQNWAFSKNMPKFDVRSRLKDIRVRTFVIVGRHDLIAPFECSQEIAQGIPHSELAIFERSGHNPAQDETEVFQARLGAFLSSLAF